MRYKVKYFTAGVITDYVDADSPEEAEREACRRAWPVYREAVVDEIISIELIPDSKEKG